MSDFRSSRLLRINSQHASVNNDEKYNCIYHIKERQLQDAKAVLLKSAKIPNTQYNVNSNNNTWVFPNTRNGGTIYTIPVGQYTINSLISELESLVDGLTITQDSITFKLTISMSTGTFDIIADKNTNPFGYFVLGGKTEILGSGGPVVLDSIPDLTGLKTVYLISNSLAPFGCMCTSERMMKSIFCSIPINAEYGEYELHEEHSALTLDFTRFASRNINSIDITLVDSQTMRPVELNGLDYELVFRVYS